MLRAVPRVVALTAALLGGAVACAGGTIDPATHTPQTVEAPPLRTRAAVFAGGCFWCMEKPRQLAGVVSTTSGYTAHPRAVVPSGVDASDAALRGTCVLSPTELVSYERLLEVFRHNVDLDQRAVLRQGASTGPASSPRSCRGRARRSRAAQKTLGKTIVREISCCSLLDRGGVPPGLLHGVGPLRPVPSGCGRDRRLAGMGRRGQALRRHRVSPAHRHDPVGHAGPSRT